MTSDHEETRTHDYRRHGTARLLAALDVATGKVVGRTVERHRSAEFLDFLDHVAEGIGPGTPVHVILDNVFAPLGRGPRVAEGPSRLDVSLHADLGVLDERRGGVLLQAGAAAAEERSLRLSGRLYRGDRGIY